MTSKLASPQAYLKMLRARLHSERKPWLAFRWDAIQQSMYELSKTFPQGRADLSDDLSVVFIIPLIRKLKAKDWDVVCALLDRTLHSLLSQSDARWRAIICGQDRPKNLADDDRIEFVQFEQHLPGELDFDKFEKMQMMVDRLSAEPGQDGYIFVLDADDLLHKDLVGHMLTTRNPNGYVIQEGFMLATDRVSGRYLGLRNLRKLRIVSDSLSGSCGSCMGCYFDTRDGGIGFKLFDALAYEIHGWFHHLSLILERPMEIVPFPAVVYNILHGNNDHGGRRQPPRLSRSHLEFIEENFLGSDETSAHQ